MEVKFPHIKVTLVGEDGNAYSILGKVTRALRAGGVPPEVIDSYKEEAMSGDYDNLLQVTMAWVDVD